MTNTYSSKKTKMKRGKGAKFRHCKCSYCLSSYFGRNHKRGNKFQWIIKFDLHLDQLFTENYIKNDNTKG